MQIKQKLESKNHEALWIYVRKQPGTEQVKDYDKLKPHFSFFSAKEKRKVIVPFFCRITSRGARDRSEPKRWLCRAVSCSKRTYVAQSV